MKILEEFWYGNMQPNERDVIPNSRLAKLLKLVAKNGENLAPMLSEDTVDQSYEQHREPRRGKHQE